MSEHIYEFSAVDRRSPPTWWCLPAWHQTVLDWEREYGHDREGGAVYVLSGGCKMSDDCPLTPEDMRAGAERLLRERGVWPMDTPLPLDVYTLARNIESEFGTGTPEEKVAIALVALNRAREEGSPSLTENLIGGAKMRYGKQIGSRVRPAATSQDPTVADVLIAALVYNGYTQGWMDDITHGATHYLDRVSQDAISARRRAEAATNSEVRMVPTGLEVYLNWSAGGDYLTWVGHIPNIRPHRLLLMKRRRELAKGGTKERAKARVAGQGAILGQNRTPRPFDQCSQPAEVIFASTNMSPANPALVAPTGTTGPDTIPGAAVVTAAAAAGITLAMTIGRALGGFATLFAGPEQDIIAVSTPYYVRRRR